MLQRTGSVQDGQVGGELFKSPYYPAYGQTHYIVKITVNAFDAYYPNPLLNGISARFVVRLVFFYVKTHLVWCKLMKPNFSKIGKSNFLLAIGDDNSGDYFVFFLITAAEC